MTTQRVLQVLDSTDATDQNLAAVQLHSVLADLGLEVRTLALGPGRRGDLAAVVPAIAPSRRSIAAHTQLRAEQRWADLVILHGADVAAVSAWSGGDVRRVLTLWDEPQEWVDGTTPSRRVRRSASRAERVIVAWDAAATTAAAVLEVDPAKVQVIHPGVRTTGHPRSVAASSAARTELGLTPDAVLVRVVGEDVADTRLDALAQAVEHGGATLLRGADLDPELVDAATDVVLVPGGSGGPGIPLLDALRAGAMVIAVDHPAMAELVEHEVTGLLVPADGASQLRAVSAAVARVVDDRPLRTALAAAAGERVMASYSAAAVSPRWLDTVHAALPSRP